ncbi:DUF1727 domain-containing protein [Pseudonocardiaceae bacterium YIM PH 21723]|nr:DUF1727 domain-containing protein [Pseudonocardiaceae bacterium YIM PH 21723]
MRAAHRPRGTAAKQPQNYAWVSSPLGSGSRQGEPVSAPLDGRTRVAVQLGKAASWLSRAAGRGSGAIIGGRVALALEPRALERLTSGRRVILVTGTNGKTTTTRMITEALGARGEIATNATGANMPDGHVAALMNKPKAGYAVLEVDEMHLDQVAEQAHPAMLVLLNLSRDQLDRVGEIRTVEQRIRKVVEANPNAVVVANADDPFIVSAAQSAKDVEWVAMGSSWRGDSASCPRCGHHIDTSTTEWHCTCGLRRPTPGWTFDGDTVTAPDGTKLELNLQLPGAFNRGNAAVALATAYRQGVRFQDIVMKLNQVSSVDGRYRDVNVNGRKARLLLAKNPASWLASLDLISDGDRPMVLVVNSREADGFDVSWLWDVHFEQLLGRRVVVAGGRAADLSVRLKYADVPHTVVKDSVAAIQSLPPGDVDVLANYTAFRDLVAKVGSEK